MILNFAFLSKPGKEERSVYERIAAALIRTTVLATTLVKAAGRGRGCDGLGRCSGSTGTGGRGAGDKQRDVQEARRIPAVALAQAEVGEKA